MNTIRACRGKLRGRRDSFIADQRGTVAFEVPIVYLFMLMTLFVPLADVAIAGFKYLSAWQALRAFGQSIQYSPPSDLTNTSSWESSARAKADSSYPISSIQILCGDSSAACSATNTATPKYYSYTTSITLKPLVLKSVLCPNSCTFTLSYSERFQ